MARTDCSPNAASRKIDRQIWAGLSAGCLTADDDRSHPRARETLRAIAEVNAEVLNHATLPQIHHAGWIRLDLVVGGAQRPTALDVEVATMGGPVGPDFVHTAPEEPALLLQLQPSRLMGMAIRRLEETWHIHRARRSEGRTVAQDLVRLPGRTARIVLQGDA